LVLHWSDSTLCDPIDRVCEWGAIIHMGANIFEATLEFLRLVIAKVRLGKILG